MKRKKKSEPTIQLNARAENDKEKSTMEAAEQLKFTSTKPLKTHFILSDQKGQGV